MIKSAITAAFIATIFSVHVIKAQDFNGRATYESKTTMNEVQINGSNITPEMKAMFEEKMKKAFEKTHELSFNKIESLYEEPQKLAAPSNSGGARVMMVNTGAAGDGKMYKNIKDKTMLSEEDFFGKEFLVADSLPKWDWKLVNETKKIGNYTCYKATAVIPVTKEDLESFEKIKKKNEGKSQILTMGEPTDRIITVWYTPEIPVSHGPGEYWGLPGLIMEVSDGKTVILCSKIVLNPKDKVVIKVPKKGKKVTKKEYEALIEKRLESMKVSKGGGIQFSIGN